jgi:hypothetical protein
LRALASLVARAGCALALAGTASALLRSAPIYAEPPLDVRGLELAPWLIGFAIVAALTARQDPRPRAARPLAGLAMLAAALLAVAVWWRGPAGLDAAGLARGPIDVTPTDLAEVRGEVVWDGPLLVPRTGRHRLWVEGRGRMTLGLDGKTVLAAEGEELDASAELLIGRGEHRLVLRYEKTGNPEMRAARIRGHRLRLGWIRPRANGEPGTLRETVAPRYLGERRSAAVWWGIDVLAAALAALIGALAFFGRWERPAAVPSPRAMGRGEWGLSLAGYAAVLAVMSWPLVLDLARRGIVDRGDGQLSVWIMAWGAHTLFQDPARFFDAPIFHPARQALAFSENMFLPAVLAAPFSWLGGPVLGYNVAFLLGAVGSGVGVQLLVRRACGDGVAAFVAGLLYAAGAHRWARIVHMHEQFTALLPFTLLALDHYWERRTLRAALLLGLSLALQALASIYLGVILATLVGLLVSLGLWAGLGLADLRRLAAGFALTGVLVAPLLAPYLKMRERYGAEWSLEAVEPHSLTPASYLASGTRLYARLTERSMDPDLRRRPLFPGVVPLALGLAGLAAAPRRHRVAGLLGSLAAFVLSLGPLTPFYRVLYENVFLFRGLRGVFRFAAVPILMLCVLAGFALAGRRRLALAALLAGLCEAWSAPLRLGAYDGPSAAARWLAERPGATAYLPMGEREDAQAMLDEIPYFRPSINGYSSFTPPHYRWLPDLMEVPLSDDALRLLRALDVRHVVSREELALPLAERLGEDRIYDVPPVEPARPAACPSASAPALWDDDAVRLDLGAPRVVTRVVLELGDDVPGRAAPRLSLSDDGEQFRPVSAHFDSGGAVLALAQDPRRACAEMRLASPEAARFVRVAFAPARRGGLVAAE